MTLPATVPDRVRRLADLPADVTRREIRRMGGSPLWVEDRFAFAYVGQAERVEFKHWLDIFPAVPPFQRIGAGDLWYTEVATVPDARVEYRLDVTRTGKTRLVLDPLNARRATNPFGTNSVAAGPDYSAPRWVRQPTADVARSKVPVSSDIYGDDRAVEVALVGDEPTVGLLVHDGSDYRIHADLLSALSYLVARATIPSVAVVLSDPVVRNAEYVADDYHARHMVGEVIPAVERSLAKTPDIWVGMGASLGAVASLHAAERHPGIFDGLILQGGSFVTALGGPFRRGPVLAPVARWMARFLGGNPSLPDRMHLSCGRFDGLIGDNRRMVEFLTGRHIDVGFDDSPDGHDWVCWRNHLDAALEHVLGTAIEPTTGEGR